MSEQQVDEEEGITPRARNMPWAEPVRYRPSILSWRLLYAWPSPLARLRIARVVLPLLAMGVFLLVWQYVPTWLGFQPFEFPPFSQAMSYLLNNWGVEIWPNLQITIVDALAGFAVGNLLAIIGAVLFSQSKLIEWTFYPLAILMQTVPIVILAPLILIVLTVLNLGPNDSLPVVGMGTKPVVIVTVLITFFPTLINMTVGLKAVDPNLFEFMQLINSSPLRDRADRLRKRPDSPRSLPAGLVAGIASVALNMLANIAERWRLLWRLRLPSSLPYLFSSFQITSTLCFVGAVVGEWMLAANTGIGGLISLYAFAVNKQGLWAAVIALSTTSISFFTLVLIAQRVFVPWRQER